MNLDPGIKVTPIVGAQLVPEPISSEELSLALQSGDLGLLEKCLTLQSNFLVHFELMSLFSKERNALSSFIRENAIEGEFVSGSYAESKLDPKFAHRVDAMIVVLNQIVAEMIEGVESGSIMAKECVIRFRQSVSLIPGVEIPRMSFFEDP